VLGTTGLVHATASRLHETIGRVVGTQCAECLEQLAECMDTIGRVPRIFCRVRGGLPRSIIHISRLIEPNLVPWTCFTDRSEISDGLRLDNVS
jgi:hypothetical protein